jgi:hypothetical protein
MTVARKDNAATHDLRAADARNRLDERASGDLQRL